MHLGAWAVMAALGSAESPQAVREIACSAIVENAEGKTDVVTDITVRVLEQTKTNEVFSYNRENTRAILCRRTDIIPLVDDFKVLAGGYPLYLVHAKEGSSRIGVLEMSEGRYRFRIIKGELTSDEKQRLPLRLDEMQERARRAAQLRRQ